jgi:hypothetical protein
MALSGSISTIISNLRVSKIQPAIAIVGRPNSSATFSLSNPAAMPAPIESASIAAMIPACVRSARVAGLRRVILVRKGTVAFMRSVPL